MYASSGSEVGYERTGSDGTYSVIGLATGTYDVCFSTSEYYPPTGGTSTTGYGSQCYNGVTWDGATSDISGPTAVHVTAGSTTSTINAALPNGGVVSGTVDDSSSQPLDNVEVDVVSSTGQLVNEAVTSTNGSYSIEGLSAGTYDVCFDANYFDPFEGGVTGGSSTTGYGNQCYNGVTWDGSPSDISGATAVHVTAGSTTGNIDAALPDGGVISGTVDDSSSHPLGDAAVEVLTTGGAEVGYAFTNFRRDILHFGPVRRYI